MMGQCLDHLQQLVRGKANNTAAESSNTDGSQSPAMAQQNKIEIPRDLHDRILGTIFGNCIGDAIGLITEFLTKGSAADLFNSYKHFEYKMKDITARKSYHQFRFPTADWTDDSDQMILILQSLTDNGGTVVPTDFGTRILDWCKHGFPELGDKAGMGCGSTTFAVLHHEDFNTDPHLAAYKVWLVRDCQAAPNGGVMRTSILGVHNHHNIERVIQNTIGICKVTHADPRCIASCIAVTTCIAMMLQGRHRAPNGSYDTKALTNDAYEYAKPYLHFYKGKEQQHGYVPGEKNIPEFEEEELHRYMTVEKLEDLKLDEHGKIGYTYKCLGAGFWAFRQPDFRKAIEALTREAGDADTNGAVAGALLGCKLGYKQLPKSWREELIHKKWLEGHIKRYLNSGIMTAEQGADGTDVDAEHASASGNVAASGGAPSAATDPGLESNKETPMEMDTVSDEAGNNNEPAISTDPEKADDVSHDATQDASHDAPVDGKKRTDSVKSDKDEQNKKVKETTG